MHKLIKESDNITDFIQKVAIAVKTYKISCIRPEASKFAQTILEMTKLLKENVEKLPELKIVMTNSTAVKIRTIEEQADILLQESLTRLIADNEDFKTVIINYMERYIRKIRRNIR